MFSLEAGDGRPVRSFGDAGVVSLTDGLARISDFKHATQSSPPVVYRDLVIVGSQVPDRVQVPDPVGYVQAFNARTGKRVVDVLRRFRSRRRIPAPRRGRTSRGGRTGTPTCGRRWRSTRPADSSICRRRRRAATTTAADGRAPTSSPNRWSASTRPPGKMKWHFQTVHHGLWDYDNPAPAQPGHDHRERPADRCGRANHQAGLHLRLRSRDGPAGLADRRTSGADRQQRAGREAVSHAAVSHQAAGVRRSGRLARRRERPDAGDQSDGAGADEEVPPRPAVHATVARRHAAAPRAGRRRQLGRRGVRSRDRLSVRARDARGRD